MSNPIPSDDDRFIQCLLTENGTSHTSGERERISQALKLAIAQKNQQTDDDRRRTAGFMVLFLFLYTVLGASLTLNIPPAVAHHMSIALALEAVPVLIAFSGFFLSVLFLFSAMASARRAECWDRAIILLEQSAACNLFSQVTRIKTGVNNYSLPAINITLAGFVCLTWLILYNYFTFTTSGVIGSVISLFISTMVYVILDIQLLKPATAEDVQPPEAPAEQSKDVIDSDTDRQP